MMINAVVKCVPRDLHVLFDGLIDLGAGFLEDHVYKSQIVGNSAQKMKNIRYVNF